MTISATFTATPHPARSPCVANETQSILTTSVAAILKIADAEHAHDLSDLPQVAGVTIGDAFHWFDRAQVLRELDRIVVPGGFVALLMSFAAGTAKPWWYPIADRVIARHLGTTRRAGPADLYRPPEGGDHETMLRASVFNQLTVSRTDQPLCMDLEQVIGHQYTQAYSSPAVLGERFADFDHELRAALQAAEPSGLFTATIQPALTRIRG